MSKLKCTKRLQIVSLLSFAASLGYAFNGKYFKSYTHDSSVLCSESGGRVNKVGFSRMVELHNGNLYDHRHIRLGRSDDYIALGNRVLSLHEHLSAEKFKLVTIVKLQQSRSGEVIVQSNKIRLVDF